MKKILLIPLLFLCGLISAQIYTPVNPTTYGEKVNRFKTLIALHLPEKSEHITGTNDTTAQIFYDKTDSSVWAWSKARGFFQIGVAGGSIVKGYGVDSVTVTVTGTVCTWFMGDSKCFDLSKFYAHTEMSIDGVKIIGYNGFGDPFDSTIIKTDFYAKWPFRITDTLTGGAKLGSISKGYLDSLGGTLQDAFNKELGQAVLTIDDTINVGERIFRIIGNGFGVFQTSFQNGNLSSVISNGASLLTLSAQNNDNNTLSGIVIRSDSISLQSNSGLGTQMNLTIKGDSITVLNPVLGDVFKIMRSDGSLYLPLISSISGTAIGNLGYDADGKIVPISGVVGGTRVYNEFITGTTDPNFVFIHPPIFGTIAMYKNGIRLKYFDDYSEDGGNVVIVFVPVLASDLFVWDYNY